MRYKDEIRIGIITACFCCAMVLVYAVVPKDVSVLRARSTSTFKEAPETAAEAQAQAQSDAEDAGFTIYSQDSNYDYTVPDDSYNSPDTSYTDNTDSGYSQDDSGSSSSSDDSSYDNGGTSYDDYANEDNAETDYDTSDQITYPTEDSTDTDTSESGVQTDYDTGGSGDFEENLVNEETFYY